MIIGNMQVLTYQKKFNTRGIPSCADFIIFVFCIGALWFLEENILKFKNLGFFYCQNNKIMLKCILRQDQSSFYIHYGKILRSVLLKRDSKFLLKINQKIILSTLFLQYYVMYVYLLLIIYDIIMFSGYNIILDYACSRGNVNMF